MRIRHYEQLYQITFLPRLFPINCYVVETPTSLIAIDMGVKKFVDALVKISATTGKKVTQLLLTHAHADHVNGVPYFHERFPTVRIGLSQRDALLLKGDFTPQVGEAQHKIKGSFPKMPIPVDFTFTDQTVIDRLKIIATPGHTPGSVAFFDAATGNLIAGDALQTQGGMAVSGDMNLTFPFPALATWDKSTAISSARKLQQLAPQRLAIGHGAVKVAPAAAMTAAIEHAEQQLK